MLRDGHRAITFEQVFNYLGAWADYAGFPGVLWAFRWVVRGASCEARWEAARFQRLSNPSGTSSAVSANTRWSRQAPSMWR